MAAEVRQPVAIRVTRPYSDEDEFLEHEIDTLTRTSVTLIGAQSRPQGVILRFEVALANGTPLMRGEGRVIAFKMNALDNLSGLTLRFTRLDKKTKALVDRAALIREERARAALRDSMTESEYPPPMPPEEASESNGAASQNGHGQTTVLIAAPAPSPPPPPFEPPSPGMASGMASAGTAENPPERSASPPPRDRDSLLLRLRERARRLAPETVAEILQDAPTSTSE